MRARSLAGSEAEPEVTRSEADSHGFKSPPPRQFSKINLYTYASNFILSPRTALPIWKLSSPSTAKLYQVTANYFSGLQHHLSQQSPGLPGPVFLL